MKFETWVNMSDLQTFILHPYYKEVNMGDLQPVPQVPWEMKPPFPEEDEFPLDGLRVSEEEYWEKYYNHPGEYTYEWNDGYLEAKPMADVKGSRMYQCFNRILDCYLTTYPIGTIVNLDIGFQLSLTWKTTVRMPDLCVILDNNPVLIAPDDCRYYGTFDLCVESLSYSSKKEIRRDTKEKKDEYEAMGVREYYILDARGIETVFYHLNRSGQYQKIRPVRKDVIRSQVLPGFQFRISDLYRQRSLEELAEDEVYHDYVFPSYKDVKQQVEKERERAEEEKRRAEEEKQRAEEEKQRAEEEKRRAEEEKQRAETAEKRLLSEQEKAEQEKIRADRLAMKLRALGIDPESLET